MTSPVPSVLAVNAGSSSTKCALFTLESEPRLLARETIDGVSAATVTTILEWSGRIDTASVAAIGHRIVHGGSRYREPLRLTPDVVNGLRQLVPLAPNHLPRELALVDALHRHDPAVPQIACFDTAFHANLPEVARRLPIPATYDARGIRRYGFHGLSYSYLMQELERLAGTKAAGGRLVLAHLGNGSSLAAVRDGRSLDTTMAFTPIGGVVMSTRSGDLDPGVVTYLMRIENLSADQVEDLLSHASGLLGISGSTSDMRVLLAHEGDDPACRLAVSAYVYSVRKAIGAFATVLGGLDTLVFSGGIGEHAPVVRARICDGLAFLGIELDSERNESSSTVISVAAGRVDVRVIPTDEELMIARAACALLRH